MGKRHINKDNSLYLKAVDLFDTNLNNRKNIYNLDFNIKLEINNLSNVNYRMMAGYPSPLRN